MSGFDKFGWLKALLRDPRFTDREARIGAAICVEFTRADGTGWEVPLTTLAAVPPSGLSVTRLKQLLARLVQMGYLVETSRSGGGRAQFAKRAHSLAGPPKPGTPAEQVSEETRYASVQNLVRQRVKPGTPALHKVASDLQQCTPTGTSTGTSTGVLRAGARERTRPDPYCSKHMPDGTTDNCGGCLRARKRCEQWDSEQERAAAEAAAAARALRENCPRCEGRGVEDLPDGTGRKCDHSVVGHQAAAL
ncbi:hypothetical protein LV457_05805 [Mycobacterium sp. MYCO198283]|uniref:hypothetical protein n=1 Tax=Mycobacterium sp. MYCO198283 TaxID=2883505 RepID=UPI001E29C31A|nr:hypothetical protein [Mycobacterium sp. MYCO198283]MCG5431806.1 hypothetical protein [Mycobacterium sp. MYCO198283]